MLTENTEWYVGILQDGRLELRRTRVILDNGNVITSIHARQVLVPGQDVSGYPLRIRQIANLIWTPQVVADWRARQA